MQFTNAYATDGLCHNSNAGSYNHECGKPAQWIGVSRSPALFSQNVFAMGFCDHCKQYGSEAKTVQEWIAL